ncbi:hypothetical protein M2650_09815 [Luteimonas sp. SX5]|uniref:Glycosyltransferase n=1 Tax=Luteimonas galliterrae TaxID=2940486 RepID=A0ABT0ML23_9GAMM|nr:hypothetical protein [Luteimonas galliterrae]MCL1634924.1 hypothetical protein [Luteimonas galliterrae]
MRSQGSASFVKAIEQAFATRTDPLDLVCEEGGTPDQLRFVADVTQYCRRTLFVAQSKIAQSVAPDIEEAWRAAGPYLANSFGCFEMAGLSHFLRSGQVAGEMPLRAARRLLDAALLHRLAAFGGSHTVATIRAAAIRDLIAISSVAQTAWLEQVVPFEMALDQDPAKVYPRMDAESKEAYRGCVEKLAAQLSVMEGEVVACALRLAQRADRSPFDHVGYYLFADGAKILRMAFGRTNTVNANWRDWTAIAGYEVLQACLTCFAVAVIALGVRATADEVAITYLCLVGVICADSLKTSVELLLGRISSARPSLAIDFVGDGLPESDAVLIAVPMHLVDVVQWNRALETARWNLAQANDTNVALVFLTDFPDSTRPGDTLTERDLLVHALASIRDFSLSLAGRPVPVHLLHRDREFVTAESCWMGKERKRGKLELLNRLIVHGENGFSGGASDGAHSICRSAKYILCLDEDARLTRNALQRMAGFLAHPLNWPRVEDGRICGGYGLAVPRTMTDEASLSTWRWPRFSVGPSVSARGKYGASRNFMYDWFAQAPFSGKGMYVPASFETLCAGRIPNGIVLSHDTIEAAWLRPGYVDKALVTDAYPASFRSFIERQDRWIRGDLQNAAILLRRLFTPSVRPPILTYFTVINQLHAWVSNAAVFAVFALMIAFDLLSTWYVAAFLAMMLGGYQRLLLNAYRDKALPGARKMRIYVPYFFRIHFAQLLRLGIAPIYALLLVRAALLTGWRLATRRKLLQWRSAAMADADRGHNGLLVALAGPASVLAAAVLLVKLHDGAEHAAIGVLALWTLCAWSNKILTRSA